MKKPTALEFVAQQMVRCTVTQCAEGWHFIDPINQTAGPFATQAGALRELTSWLCDTYEYRYVDGPNEFLHAGREERC